MLILVGLFVFWLALHGRLGTYAGLVTTGPGWGSASTAGATVNAPSAGGTGAPVAVTPGNSTQVGPVTVVNTQPGVSTGQAVLNNIGAAIAGLFGKTSPATQAAPGPQQTAPQ